MTGEMDVEDGDDDDDVDSEAEEEAAEEAAEEAEAADAAAAAADRQQQHDGGATESPVSSIAETRSRLLKDRVAEITYRDEPGVYLALVTETPAARANKVSHLWLHEVLDGSDLYIMDPWNRGESKTPIRKVAEPLSSVEELLPAEAGQALAGEALRLALDAIRSDPGARLQPGTLRVWRRRPPLLRHRYWHLRLRRHFQPRGRHQLCQLRRRHVLRRGL